MLVIGLEDTEVLVLVSGPALEPDQDLHGPAVEGLGLGQPVGVLEQRRQVVEVAGDVGMIGAIAPLVDRQGATVERLGLG
jgi:hypothetical protein